MSDIVGDPTLIFLYIGLPVLVILYGLGRFEYRVDGGRFLVRWWILGCVPIYWKSFPLETLVSMRRFRWPRDVFSFATPLGNLFSKNRTILEFQGIRRRRLAITPESYESLHLELSRYLSQSEQEASQAR